MNKPPGAPRTVDPLAAIVRRMSTLGGEEPLLARLDFDVTVRSALAVVETKRTYRNERDESVEALLTIPVPVHAAFFGLTARTGDRVLTAQAQAKSDARRETS